MLKSEGNQYYSYAYVGDVVAALVLLLEKGHKGEAYNVSDVNSDIHLKDLATLIANCGNKKVVFDLPNGTYGAISLTMLCEVNSYVKTSPRTP